MRRTRCIVTDHAIRAVDGCLVHQKEEKESEEKREGKEGEGKGREGNGRDGMQEKNARIKREKEKKCVRILVYISFLLICSPPPLFALHITSYLPFYCCCLRLYFMRAINFLLHS